MLELLGLLRGLVRDGHPTVSPLHGAVLQHLLAADVLLLLGPEALLLLGARLQHLLLPYLLLTLVKDRSLLLLVKALEVVRFDAVRREHRLFSGGVLGHEIMVGRVGDVRGSARLTFFESGLVTVALLKRHLVVGCLVLDGQGVALCGVRVLCLLQKRNVLHVLLVTGSLDLGSCLAGGGLFSGLLLDPFLLL